MKARLRKKREKRAFAKAMARESLTPDEFHLSLLWLIRLGIHALIREVKISDEHKWKRQD